MPALAPAERGVEVDGWGDEGVVVGVECDGEGSVEPGEGWEVGVEVWGFFGLEGRQGIRWKRDATYSRGGGVIEIGGLETDLDAVGVHVAADDLGVDGGDGGKVAPLHHGDELRLGAAQDGGAAAHEVVGRRTDKAPIKNPSGGGKFLGLGVGKTAQRVASKKKKKKNLRGAAGGDGFRDRIRGFGGDAAGGVAVRADTGRIEGRRRVGPALRIAGRGHGAKELVVIVSIYIREAIRGRNEGGRQI